MTKHTVLLFPFTDGDVRTTISFEEFLPITDGIEYEDVYYEVKTTTLAIDEKENIMTLYMTLR
jgi:hypothetical protein